MTIEIFENFLNKPESEVLDFKSEQYNFPDGSHGTNTAKFVKDIISFCNTIRTETAYIILGVSLSENGEKELIGIQEHIDDAVFQEKIKDKVTPLPHFCYSTIEYKHKCFGIIEIPIRRYEEPLFPTVKMKGLDPGKVYCRRGSSNSEATGREIILINKWLESLPSQQIGLNISDEISEILIKTTAKRQPLSKQIAASLILAKKFGVEKLKTFCEGELSGWHGKIDKLGNENYLAYRTQKVVMTPNDIEINPYSLYKPTPQQMLEEIKKIDEDAKEQPLLFSQSITEIEGYLDNLSKSRDHTFLKMTINADQIFSNPKLAGITIKIYSTIQTFEALYQSIRQKLISNLLEI